MIKGVNKKIVEINYTKNDYIEKAILIINPEKANLPNSIIEKEADEYMTSIMATPKRPEIKLTKKRKKPKKTSLVLTGIIYTLLASLLTTIVINLIV